MESPGTACCGDFGQHSDTAWGKNDHFGHFQAPPFLFSIKNRHSSSLNEGDYDSRIIYSGKVTDLDHATLTWYENDKEITITLEALRYE